jgi:glycosyltransferase involved in cell wall biosynthesis
MAVLEAMASAVVPVVTSVGAIPDVVTDGVSGVLVTPGDIEQLAKALESLLTDADLRNRLAAGAFERAGDFHIDSWRESLHTLWTAVATRGATGSAR